MSEITMAVAGEPFVDNVVRKREFEAAHPDVLITSGKLHPRDPSWAAVWTGAITVNGQRHTIRARELGDLLGRLERLAAQRDEPGGRP